MDTGGGLGYTPGYTLPGAKTKRVPKMADQPGKIEAKSEASSDSSKAVNTFMPYKAPGPESIYPVYS